MTTKSQEEVMNRLTEIFRSVLHQENLHLSPDDSAQSIEKWDSINHLTLIHFTEERFGIKFTLRESMQLVYVRDFVRLVLEKTN